MAGEENRHLLSERMERWPVFGLERLIERRRVDAWYRKYTRLMRTDVSRIAFGVSLGATVILALKLLDLGAPIIKPNYFVYDLFFHVFMPIFAGLHIISEASNTLSRGSRAGLFHGCLLAGYAPSKIANELVLARAIRILPFVTVTSVTVVVIFVSFNFMFWEMTRGTHATLFSIQQLLDAVSALPSRNFMMFTAMFLTWYLVFLFAIYFGAVLGSHATRFALSFGFVLILSIGSIGIELVAHFISNGTGVNTFFREYLHAVLSTTNPFQALVHAEYVHSPPSWPLFENPMFSYIKNVSFQLSLGCLFYILAVRAFKRRLIS